MADDDDLPTLSAETFAALQEYYDEEKQREDQRSCTTSATSAPKSMADFAEDWQLSQFWYDEATASKLAEKCLKSVAYLESSRIACISCPTLYLELKKTLPDGHRVNLFEYDKRFSAFGQDFIFYDYRSPLDIPRDLRENFDIVFADPPFLSEECMTKTCVTVKYLAKKKIIVCSGESYEIIGTFKK